MASTTKEPEHVRPRRSLVTRWTLGVLVVAVVPLVLLAFFVTDVQRRGLSRAEKELEAAVVDEAAQRVLAALDQASDTAARSEAVFMDAQIDVDARTRLLTDLVARAKAISGIAFFDAEGHFVDAVVREGKDDPALHLVPAREGFRAIETAEPLSTLNGGTTKGTVPVLRYERRLLNDGVLRGWVVVGVAGVALDERLRDLSKVRFGAP